MRLDKSNLGNKTVQAHLGNDGIMELLHCTRCHCAAGYTILPSSKLTDVSINKWSLSYTIQES